MQEYIWVLWDLLAVAVLIYFVYAGARHGFVRTLIGLVGYGVAYFLARAASPLAAERLYEGVVRDSVKLTLTRRLEEFLAGGMTGSPELADAIPALLLRLMGVDALDTAEQALQANADQWIDTLIDTALREPILSLLQGLFFLIIFTLAVMAVRFLARAFSRRLGRLPVLGTLNTLLGGVIGVGEALLALFILSLALQLVILFTGGGHWWLSDAVMDETYILRIFYNILRL